MNKQDLGNHLRDTPETTISVSPRLHQDIMRAVRLAEPVPGRAFFRWSTPAWGAALAAIAVIIFQLTQTPEPQAPELVELRESGQAVSLMAFGDKLVTISEESLLPEKELKLELERLKADLQRFDFRS